MSVLWIKLNIIRQIEHNLTPLKGWSPNQPNADVTEKHGHSYAHDYLTNLVANRSCQWLEYEHKLNPERPLLLTVNFPAPHGPEVGFPFFLNLNSSFKKTFFVITKCFHVWEKNFLDSAIFSIRQFGQKCISYPKDAAPPWQGVFNTTKPPILNENYNYVNNEKKHHVLRKDTDFG